MRLMPNISLTEKEVENLTTRRVFNYGGEAVICQSENPHTLYKLFTAPHSREVIPMTENKETKITMLHLLKLKNSTYPLSTISMNGKLIGYEMTKAIDYLPIFLPDLSREEIIHMLREAKNTLEYFASKDITYGDIKNDNLLVNPKTGEIMFCDMDNIRLGTREIDIASYELECFLQCYGKTDEKADAYMHNLLTLEMLNYPNIARYQYIIELMRCGEIPTGYNLLAHDTLKSMLCPQNFDGEYIIENLIGDDKDEKLTKYKHRSKKSK